MGRKNQSGKRIAKRDTEPKKKKSKPAEAPVPVQPKTPPIRERPREKDSGFGVLKFVAGAILVLILGSVILMKVMGHDDIDRGDKMPGEQCESTRECERGSICYAYKGTKNRCYTTCSTEKGCSHGFTCTSSAEKAGRRSARVRAVCVEDAKL